MIVILCDESLENRCFMRVPRNYRVSQKKQGFVFSGHFKGLDVLKLKSRRKQTPPKMSSEH